MSTIETALWQTNDFQRQAALDARFEDGHNVWDGLGKSWSGAAHELASAGQSIWDSITGQEQLDANRQW